MFLSIRSSSSLAWPSLSSMWIILTGTELIDILSWKISHGHLRKICLCYWELAQFSYSVQSDSATPWTAAYQTSLSITNSRSLLKLMSIELVMPFNHLSLCHPLLLLPPIFPSIMIFSNKVAKVLKFQLQHHSFQYECSGLNFP